MTELEFFISIVLAFTVGVSFSDSIRYLIRRVFCIVKRGLSEEEKDRIKNREIHWENQKEKKE